MDNQPGRWAGNHSKLTDKFIAGRGRALKEFAKRTLKAEEVEKRKQIQQLILSGKIALDKGVIEKHLSSGLNGTSGSTSSVSSSSSHLQIFEGNGNDNFMDSTHEKASSKVPVGSQQFQGQACAKANYDNLENRMQQLNLVEEEKNGVNDRIPPRFRNSQKNRNLSKQPSKTWVKHQKQEPAPRNSKTETGFVESQAPGYVFEARPQESISTWPDTQQNWSTSSNAWQDWEESVVVHSPIDEEYLEEIVVVDDNDNLDDVMVQQYVNALHEEQMNGAKPDESKSTKVTPSLIQELGNLKSTINADSHQTPPGTIPNPPKGPDRWGGWELKGINQPTGWGDIVEDNGNWYDDGTAVLWGVPSLPYGASGGWSWNS